MAKHTNEETIIAHGVRVEGEFVSQGNVVIEGEVQGTLHAGGDLRVGEEAKITADVSAANAFIAGELHGNLRVAGRLELTSTSKIMGDVTTEVLLVAAGAKINGTIAMTGKSGAKEEEAE